MIPLGLVGIAVGFAIACNPSIMIGAPPGFTVFFAVAHSYRRLRGRDGLAMATVVPWAVFSAFVTLAALMAIERGSIRNSPSPSDHISAPAYG